MRYLFLSFIALLVLGTVSQEALSQTRLLNSMKLVNPATGTGQRWEANAASTSSQGFTFPSSVGTTSGQILVVNSVTSANAQMTWSLPAGSFASQSSVLATTVTDGGGVAAGQSVSVPTGNWRIFGEFDISRGVAGDPDIFDISISGFPATGLDLDFVFECVNCTANATFAGVNTSSFFLQSSVTTLTAGGVMPKTASDSRIDPNSAGNAGGTTFHYRLEGVIRNTNVASSNLTFGFNKATGTGNVSLLAGSYWYILPLK